MSCCDESYCAMVERERIIEALWQGPFFISMRDPDDDDCTIELDSREKFNLLRKYLEESR